MITAITTAPTRMYRMGRNLASVGSNCTSGCVGWPSEEGVESWVGSVIFEFPFECCLFEVGLAKSGHRLSVGVMGNKKGPALQLPEEVSKPQPTHANGCQEVHPVIGHS